MLQPNNNPMKFRPSILLTNRATAVTMAVATAMTFSPAIASAADLDGDGISNKVDRDVDGDGAPNGIDSNVDGGVCKRGPFKGKYVGDRLKNDSFAEKDIDGDNLDDDADEELDIDGDGKKDDSTREFDIDGDKRKDDSLKEDNIDGDDYDDDSPDEDDIDGDGKTDDDDEDIDGDDDSNADDDDCDGDGKGRDDDDDDDGDDIDDDSDDDDDGDGIDDDDVLELEASLTPTANAPAKSRMRVKIKQLPGGEFELEFDGRGLAEGAYDVVVNSQVLGQLEMEEDDGRTEGEVEFETTPDDEDELPLPFDPSGLPVEIVKDGLTYFNGTVPTTAAP